MILETIESLQAKIESILPMATVVPVSDEDELELSGSIMVALKYDASLFDSVLGDGGYSASTLAESDLEVHLFVKDVREVYQAKVAYGYLDKLRAGLHNTLIADDAFPLIISGENFVKKRDDFHQYVQNYKCKIPIT